MDSHGASDLGRKRLVNEDQFLIADLSKSLRVHQTSLGLDDQTRLFGNTQGILMMVADGMGGHASGDLASRIAVDSVTRYMLNTMQWFWRLEDQNEDDFLEHLKTALEYCQSDILSQAVEMPQHQGMGTTVTMAYVVWPRLYVVHAGDSRCYLQRNGKLQQITRDHTVAQKFVDRGDLSQAQADASPWSHVLWKVVGGSDEAVNAEVSKATLEIGDTVLLCTDGLQKHVGDHEINEMLSQRTSAAETCGHLIARAIDGGGSDNVTVVVSKFMPSDADKAAGEDEMELPTDEPTAPDARLADSRLADTMPSVAVPFLGANLTD